LYYIPIVYAALADGWRGGLTAALISGVGFMIGTPAIWTVAPAEKLDQVLEICVFCMVGGVAGVLSDRRRRQEWILRRTTAQLDRAHHQLRENFEAMKRTEQLSALGQLSAGLAHEIRNPLASIEGAATVMQRDLQNQERRREFLEIIQKETRRLNRLLTNFLDFAKPRQPDLKIVAINGLLDSVMELAQHAVQNGRLELELVKEVQPDLQTVRCDEEQIKQVLLNLVMNAIQAMPQGGRVVLAAQRSGSEVAIDVQDQGSGISSGNVERVFDPFFTTKPMGSGLGLSIAHQIVTQHGGAVKITRNSAAGLTVRVLLPGEASSS
jgi:signal transduction histidine kinase